MPDWILLLLIIKSLIVMGFAAWMIKRSIRVRRPFVVAEGYRGMAVAPHWHYTPRGEEFGRVMFTAPVGFFKNPDDGSLLQPGTYDAETFERLGA